MRPPALLCAFLIAIAACSSSSSSSGYPKHTVTAKPDYLSVCADGIDTYTPCLQVTLAAIDNARAAEKLPPMRIPADFGSLSVAQQLLIAVNQERVVRGLPPFAGLTADLSALAQRGADAQRAPDDPAGSYTDGATEWIGDAGNGLDAVFEWVYDDGPGAGIDGCVHAGDRGCWADRQTVLDRLGGRDLVMGAAATPAGSVAAVFAAAAAPPALTYAWANAAPGSGQPTLTPLLKPPSDQSATGIPDPPRSLDPVPDFTNDCSESGLDSSAHCIGSVLAAINHARALEGVKPMVLPADFGTLDIPHQVFVAVNLERADRGLPTFTSLTPSLDRNAQIGADRANDPPDPGNAYDADDTEWAGGSVNGLDAMYGWMYDDGLDSGNLDCPARGGPGCWGHRHGILDDFGTTGTLVMGAAVNPTGDSTSGDKGGPSIAATLAITASSSPQ